MITTAQVASETVKPGDVIYIPCEVVAVDATDYPIDVRLSSSLCNCDYESDALRSDMPVIIPEPSDAHPWATEDEP